MAKPSEKLAESLEILRELQAHGTVAIRSGMLSRTHRERLSKNGFLQEVIKGWYIPTRPEDTIGDSTEWYSLYWAFCADYLEQLKGKDWCLSPEQSISLHAENWTVPSQLMVRAAKARNNVTALLNGTSLLDIRTALPLESDAETKAGLRIYTLPASLLTCAPGFYNQNPTDMRAALNMVRDASELLDQLLEGGHTTMAGRLVGAFRNIGRDNIADDILAAMQSAGYAIRENDPFESQSPIALSTRERSPYVNRINLMWQEMREQVIQHFPAAPGLPKNSSAYMKQVEEIYITDAYHSLSIEGYRVTPELIERVRTGSWNPDANQSDLEHHNAVAARGYWQAYQTVLACVAETLKGESAGGWVKMVARDRLEWWRLAQPALRCYYPSRWKTILIDPRTTMTINIRRLRSSALV